VEEQTTIYYYVLVPGQAELLFGVRIFLLTLTLQLIESFRVFAWLSRLLKSDCIEHAAASFDIFSEGCSLLRVSRKTRKEDSDDFII
jgi:hypothetical protein